MRGGVRAEMWAFAVVSVGLAMWTILYFGYYLVKRGGRKRGVKGGGGQIV